MEVVIAGGIAVLGTLLGSLTTHLFQQRTIARSEQFTRAERLRQDRIDSYSAFGGALANYRRGHMDLWFVQHARAAAPDVAEMRREEQRLRTIALEAYFRVQLLTDAPEVIESAGQALRAIDRIDQAESREDLERERSTSRSLIYDFVSTAKSQVALRENRPTACRREKNSGAGGLVGWVRSRS